MIQLSVNKGNTYTIGDVRPIFTHDIPSRVNTIVLLVYRYLCTYNPYYIHTLQSIISG